MIVQECSMVTSSLLAFAALCDVFADQSRLAQTMVISTLPPAFLSSSQMEVVEFYSCVTDEQLRVIPQHVRGQGVSAVAVEFKVTCGTLAAAGFNEVTEALL